MIATMTIMMICIYFFFPSSSSILFPLEVQESKNLRKSPQPLKKFKLMGECQGKGTSTMTLKLNLKDSCSLSTKCHPCPCRQSHLNNPGSARQLLEGGTRKGVSEIGDGNQVPRDSGLLRRRRFEDP